MMSTTLNSTAKATPVPANTLAGTRHDVYGLIHKGLRAFMCDTLARLGRVDLDAPPTFAGAIAQTQALLGTLHEHLQHENRFLHTALEARLPGGSTVTAIEHADHEKAFIELGALSRSAEEAFAQGRRPELASLTKQLYLSLSFFVAENLAHMHREETEITGLLWRVYSDDELRDIEGAIVASESPEQLATGMRWMLPALTPGERAGLLGGARQGLPPAAFQGLMALAESVLPTQDYVQLARALA